MMENSVYLSKCIGYNQEFIDIIIKNHLIGLGVNNDMIRDKVVVIKPNLVINKSPEHAATTHPQILKGVLRYLKTLNPKQIIIAESYGGPYTESSLKIYYKACGITAVAEEESVDLNFDTSSSNMSFLNGKRCKLFNVITPIHNADVVFNLCKLKTHSLTKMSCGIKNFFGIIPGIEKFEMHARFAEHQEFTEMIVDLCQMICETKKVVTVCDAITGMEGNGPTGGNPRDFNVILSSLSPFALDVVAEHLLGFDNTVPIVNEAKSRGLVSNIDEISVIGDDLNLSVVDNVKLPDTNHLGILKKMPDLFGGKFAKFFQPYPEINKKTCIGCGTCAKSCPAHTITINNKLAIIDHNLCIRCYCCQELCPINSVYIKKNLLLKLVQKL